jgi:hypothetical protein
MTCLFHHSHRDRHPPTVRMALIAVEATHRNTSVRQREILSTRERKGSRIFHSRRAATTEFRDSPSTTHLTREIARSVGEDFGRDLRQRAHNDQEARGRVPLGSWLVGWLVLPTTAQLVRRSQGADITPIGVRIGTCTWTL